MDNRLLSEQEIIGILGWPTMPDYELHQATAAAQLAKTDKEWVEWLEKTFYPSANWSDFDNEVWKARKKEIGL
jgi:hypothetical protein